LPASSNLLAELLYDNQHRTAQPFSEGETLSPALQADIGALVGALDNLVRVARIKAVE
jgi:hypothetical protein